MEKIGKEEGIDYREIRECNGINCLYTNIRSIMNKGKREELQILTRDNKIDILGITESWTHEGIEDAEIMLSGYNLFRRDRKNRNKKKGGGVLMYVKEGFKSQEIMQDDGDCEALYVSVKSKRFREIIIGVCYRSPNAEREEIENLFRSITKRSVAGTVIMGDFNYGNINWENMAAFSAEDEGFLEMVQDCFLTQHVDRPTRGNHILDLILSTEPELVEGVNVGCPVANSDHNTIKFVIAAEIVGRNRKREVARYHKADYEKICNELETVQWKEILEGKEVEQAWNIIKEEMLESVRRWVPKGIGKTRKYPFWMKSRIRKMIKARDRAWKRYCEKPSYENHQTYKIRRNGVTKEIRRAKRDFEIKIAENIKEDPKTFYAYVKSKSKTIASIGPLKWKEKIIEEEEEMADVLNEYFASVFTEENKITVPEVHLNDRLILSEINVTEEKVFKAVNKMKANKAGGVDGLVSTYLKGSIRGIVRPLVKVFNESMEKTIIPKDWKDANVAAIFKKGKKNDPANYRPVSLTSNIGKIFEKVIKEEITSFLEKNNLIRESQHGFRSGKSCLTNLLEFMEKVAEYIDRGDPVDVIFLDFQKAFDKVPHMRLMAKVEEMGIAGKVLDWIREWLRGRKQRVVINGKASGWRDVVSGVPQGSILGPLLFVIYINDIDRSIVSRILKFADDTKIFGKVGTKENVNTLKEDLEEIVKWSEKWQMKFNVEKCKVMHLGNKNLNLDYCMEGRILEKVKEEKDLGIIISENFKVHGQCVKAAKKGNQVLGLIKRTITCKNKEIIIKLYKALVRPHLEYCGQAWRPHLRGDINMLEKVQRRATRMIEGCKGKEYNERLKIAGLTTLEKEG